MLTGAQDGHDGPNRVAVTELVGVGGVLQAGLVEREA